MNQMNAAIICHFRFLILVVFAVALGGCSQSGGGFYVVPEHKDLGVIKDKNRIAVAEFEIFNELDRPVKIENIYPSCNCTTVKLVDNPIPPGKSTILRAEANLSKQAGKQTYSIVFTTDSLEFPSKTVSFEVLVPATGTRQRRLSIGSFYPGVEINLELPTSSITQGSVEQLEGSNDQESAIVTHIADIKKETMLIVKGTAPHAVGPFSKKISFREWMPEQPSLGESIVEVELAGNVIARWIVEPDLYTGFVSLDKDGGIITLSIQRNSATTEKKKLVSKISATLSEDWLSLQSQSVSPDRIELKFKIDEDKLEHLGAVRCETELKIQYTDGDVESYSTNLFAHINH